MEELKRFLEELKQVVKEGRELYKAFSLLLSGDGSVEEKAEHLKKRLDSNMKVTQDNIDLEKLTNEEVKKYAYVFEPFVQNKKYKKGDCVEQHGRLFRALKAHTSDYQNMPNIDDGTYWEEITGTGEVVKPIKKRENYQRDKTYKPGDEVVFYNKAYVYVGKTNEAGKDPEKDTDFWKPIEV